MATQEERLTKLENSVASFQRDMVTKTRETNENSTILLGLYYKQSIEIKDIHKRLDTMDQRLDTMDQRLDTVDQRLGAMDQRLISIDQRMETKFDEQAQLLQEILKRLP